MGRATVRRPVTMIGRSPARAEDLLATEEPLEMRAGGRVLNVTMRTPGHDIELVHGWLHAEGAITQPEDVATARYCAGTGDDGLNTYNVLDLALRVPPPAPRSTAHTTSACGACGSASIEALAKRGRFDVASDAVTVHPDVLVSLPEQLRTAQKTFEATGGLHAAGLYTATGEPLVVREDVGRHNAVDKVVGWALLNGKLPLSGTVLQVSGRASFELAQKAYLAGIPVLSAVSAPSSLAVDVALDVGLTLAGFVRDGRATLYSRPDRVTGTGAEAVDPTRR